MLTDLAKENTELRRKVERLDYIRLLYLTELQKASKGIARLNRKIERMKGNSSDEGGDT